MQKSPFTARVEYQGNLRTSAVHLKSNTRIITDAPTDNEGKGEAFSPTDLVATALASCMLTLMGIAAHAHSINLGKIAINVRKMMESNPRRISELDVELIIEDLNFSKKEKNILETAAITCPVAKSLNAEIIQNVVFQYVNAAQ